MGRWSRHVTWADAQERVTASRHDPSIGTHGVYQGTGHRADVIAYAIAQHDDDRATPWEASCPRHVPDLRAGMPSGSEARETISPAQSARHQRAKVPILYATTSGAPYVRFEIERV